MKAHEHFQKVFEENEAKKAYLCLEKDREAFHPIGFEGEKERPAAYFVIKAKDNEGAKRVAEPLGATVIRVLTDKELTSEAKDGSYDIEL